MLTTEATQTPAVQPDITPPVDPNAAPVPAQEGAPTPDAPKRDDKFAARFAALTRQEKQLRQQQAEHKARMEQERKEWEAEVNEARGFKETKAKAKTDKTMAMQALQELGLSYEDITQLILNDNKPTPEMIARQAQEEVARLRQEQVDREKKAKDDAENVSRQRVEEIITSFKQSIGNTLEAKSEEYELTHSSPDGAEMVYNVIEAQHEKDGRVLTVDEAIQSVEAYLEKEIEEKILSRKKIQKRFGPLQPGEAAATPSPEGVLKSPTPITGNQPARTLTNSAQTGAATPTQKRSMTPEESKAEAAKLLKWK